MSLDIFHEFGNINCLRMVLRIAASVNGDESTLSESVGMTVLVGIGLPFLLSLLKSCGVIIRILSKIMIVW